MAETRPGRAWRETEVVRALREFSGETETYVAAAGRGRAMHRTDLAGLAVVMDQSARGHAVTPRLLSTSLNLSAPATTAMLDRLEQAGHVRRTPHPDDRRSVRVEITDHALEVGGAMFGPLGAAVARVLAGYDDEQLDLVTEFLDKVSEATRQARGVVGGPG